MKTTTNPSPTPITTEGYTGPERRLATSARRATGDDRRNLDRILDDDNPRRDPERTGRRTADTQG